MMKGAEDLAKAFVSVPSAKEMARFFNEIFTAAEREDFALRWRLMKMLNSGVSQREIAARLGISLCKITRGAKIIKDENSVTRKILDKGVN